MIRVNFEGFLLSKSRIFIDRKKKVIRKSRVTSKQKRKEYGGNCKKKAIKHHLLINRMRHNMAIKLTGQGAS